MIKWLEELKQEYRWQSIQSLTGIIFIKKTKHLFNQNQLIKYTLLDLQKIELELLCEDVESYINLIADIKIALKNNNDLRGIYIPNGYTNSKLDLWMDSSELNLWELYCYLRKEVREILSLMDSNNHIYIERKCSRVFNTYINMTIGIGNLIYIK